MGNLLSQRRDIADARLTQRGGRCPSQHVGAPMVDTLIPCRLQCAGSPMAQRVWQQEERLLRMLAHLGISPAVAARSGRGDDMAGACAVCIECWEPLCERRLDGRCEAAHPRDYCPNWPVLERWLGEMHVAGD